MARSEIINRYIDRFLADKTPEAAANFRARDEKRQYQSIMTWRYNMRKQGIDVETEANTGIFVETLRGLIRRLDRMQSMGIDQLDAIGREMETLSQHLEEFKRRQRVREIEDLEAQSLQIAEKLDMLRREQHSEQPRQ